MSRDFELLQRLEREKDVPSILFDGGRAHSSEKPGGTLRLVGKRPEAVRPVTQMSTFVQAEVSRLVLRTFLATPSIRSVMFTGVEAKQGAKWLAACTADVLASTSHGRVCLMDADLDSPAMHLAYSVSNHNGLGALLSAECSLECAAIGIADNLWLVPAGTRAENQSITLENARRLCYRLQQECEYLIVSGPECGSYQEMAALASATEGTILVLDAMRTRRASAQRAKALLEAAQARIIGSVMTSRGEAVPEFLSHHMR